MRRNRTARPGITAEKIKDEIRVELRNIILYRQELLKPIDRLDYEEVQKKIVAFAGAVYHFKERLAAWVKKRGLVTRPGIMDIACSSIPLQVCGDLFNAKKHGGNNNDSKLDLELSEMKLQTANETIGIRYDGQMKTGDLNRAVPYCVEIYCSENRTLGDAVRYISRAFSQWTPVIRTIGLLDDSDSLDARLLMEIEPFAQDEP